MEVYEDGTWSIPVVWSLAQQTGPRGWAHQHAQRAGWGRAELSPRPCMDHALCGAALLDPAYELFDPFDADDSSCEPTCKRCIAVLESIARGSDTLARRAQLAVKAIAGEDPSPLSDDAQEG